MVEEGQNPRDEAIKVLDQAQKYVTAHIYLQIEKDGKAANEQTNPKLDPEPKPLASA